MKEFLKRAAVGIHAGAELYRKLSRVEKISCAVLVAVAVFAVLWFAVSEDASTYRVVATEDGRDGPLQLQRVASRLDEIGIAWRAKALDDGGRAVEVPEANYRRALAALEKENPQPAANDSEWAEKSVFLDTPDRLEARLRDVNRRKIEQAILWNGSIQTATIAISQSRRPVFARSRDGGDSAAVVLCLKRGVRSLHRQEADAIREMVRCAFGLRSAAVSISDNFGKAYDPASDKDVELDAASSRVNEKEAHLRNLIRDDIQQMYSRAFEAREYFVGVIVSLSPQRSSIEKKEMDREKSFKLDTKTELERGPDAGPGGILSPSDGPIHVREWSTSVPFDSYEKTLIDIPPGELKGVSVVVHLDLDAVERVEAARREIPGTAAGSSPAITLAAPSDREAIIKRYVARQEESLKSFLKVLGNVSVTVMVHPFVKPQPDAPARVASRFAGIEPAPLASEALNWIEKSWRSIVTAAALLLCGFFAVKTLRRRGATARGEEWPALPTEGVAPGAAASGLRGTFDPDWTARRPQRSSDRLGVLPSVDDTGTAVRERPEVASSVLRLWLAQETEEAKEGAQRA